MELHQVWVYFEAQPTIAQSNDDQQSTTGKVKKWDDLFEDESAVKKAVSLPTDIRISHRALVDIQPEQTNIVSVRIGQSAAAIVLNAKTPTLDVSFEDRKTGWQRKPSVAARERQGVKP